jgi:hypothetical protein
VFEKWASSLVQNDTKNDLGSESIRAKEVIPRDNFKRVLLFWYELVIHGLVGAGVARKSRQCQEFCGLLSNPS